MEGRKRMAGLILGCALFLCGARQPAEAAEPVDSACLDCHEPAARIEEPHADLACVDCHAGAGELPHPQTLPPVDCAACHADQAADYRLGVHGPHDAAPAALCADCHGTHAILSMVAFRSPLHRGEVSSLCGRCHADIAATYRESIHGRAVASGIHEAPVCTDCHGEHAIAGPADPASSVSPHNIPVTCAACHEEERIAAKYGLPMRRFTTYLDSYHGVVNRHGDAAVANCASCHGVHDIRPSADPKSAIHPDNLGETCGGCHPGVGRSLAGARIHVEATRESSKGMYYVRIFYTYFIGGLMVCFVAYMAIEIYGNLRRRRR